MNYYKQRLHSLLVLLRHASYLLNKTSLAVFILRGLCGTIYVGINNFPDGSGTKFASGRATSS